MGHLITTNFVLFAVATMLVSVGLMLAVRKAIGLPYLRTHHEVSDPLLACVGTLFAILLGFMVANAMTRFEEARVNVEREAGAISDIYRLSRGLPDRFGTRIRSDCLSYVSGVIDVEWKQMADRKMSYVVWKQYGQIWTDCLEFEPQTNRETNIHATMLSSMVNLGDCRRVRATQMSYAVPEILWVVVMIGACATGTLVLFFGIENIVIQSFTTALVSLVLFLNVFLLASYDDPFSGDVSVKPHAFEVARESLNRRYKDVRPDTPEATEETEVDPEEEGDEEKAPSGNPDEKSKINGEPVSESSNEVDPVQTF
jgi:hypothetical protein